MITHDLGVVAEIADDVVVMYAARGGRAGAGRRLFDAPAHPYTWGLLGSLPRLDIGRPPRPDSRPAAVAAQPAERLPLPPALSVRDGHLPERIPPLSRPGGRCISRRAISTQAFSGP